MNALRHGLRAQRAVLPDEDQEEFNQLHAALQAQYQPQNPSEQHLLDQAALAQWKLVRAEVFEARCYAETSSASAHAAIFGRMTQFQCRLERAFFKAYKELERIKAARQKQPEPSKQPEQPGKKEKYEHPPKLQVNWLDPSTGEREVLFRSEYGKPVEHFSDEPPAQAKPPIIPPR